MGSEFKGKNTHLTFKTNHMQAALKGSTGRQKLANEQYKHIWNVQPEAHSGCDEEDAEEIL